MTPDLRALRLKAKPRFWLSWPQPTEDYRPLTDPPVVGILGWWCSGYDGEDRAILIALVEANTMSAAKSLIRQSWPEAPAKKASWRIEDERPTGWVPGGDRFPLPQSADVLARLRAEER